jgi:hypothetical protein
MFGDCGFAHQPDRDTPYSVWPPAISLKTGMHSSLSAPDIPFASSPRPSPLAQKMLSKIKVRLFSPSEIS